MAESTPTGPARSISPTDVAPTTERCRKHVPRCECDYCDEAWRKYALEDYGLELPEVAPVCRHHPEIGDDDE